MQSISISVVSGCKRAQGENKLINTGTKDKDETERKNQTDRQRERQISRQIDRKANK